MKKVLYFVPEFPRLTETFIEREISKLVAFGVLDVSVLSLQKASGYLSPNLEKHVFYRRLGVWCCFKSLKFFIKSPRIIWKYVKMGLTASKFGSKLSNAYLVLKSVGFASVFAEFKPDHIHVHFLSDPSTIAMVVSELLGIPFSISGHARDVFVDGTFIPQKVTSAKFLSICNSYAWDKCVQLSGGVNSKHVHKIYHGMDLDKVLNEPPKKQKPNRPMIFVGSRLVEKKGLIYMIEASKILRDRGVNHEVHIVGPGPLYGQLVSMVKSFNLSDHIFIPGEGKGISNADIMEYYKIADIFAHPSIETGQGDVDGVPTFVIEACMAKLPVVTTSAGGITDLINSDTGVLIPQKNAIALADAIEKLIYTPDLRKSLGEKGYIKAKEMFNLNNNVGALQKLLLS